MLTRGERSGYDLLKAIEGGVGFFWTPAKSQLYALLPKLVERGLLKARRVEQEKRPDKTLYRITPAGRHALRDGLMQASPAVDRNAFELRVFFGEHLKIEPDIRGTISGMTLMILALQVIPFVDRARREPAGWRC